MSPCWLHVTQAPTPPLQRAAGDINRPWLFSAQRVSVTAVTACVLASATGLSPALGPGWPSQSWQARGDLRPPSLATVLGFW